MRICPLIIGAGAAGVALAAYLLRDRPKKEQGEKKDAFVSHPPRRITNDTSTNQPRHPILTPHSPKGLGPTVTLAPPARELNEEEAPALALKNLGEMRGYLDHHGVRYRPLSGEEDGSLILEKPQPPFDSVRYEYNEDGTLLSLDVEIGRAQFEARLGDYLPEENRQIMAGFLRSQKDRFAVVIHRGDIHMEGWETWPDNFKPIYESAIRRAVHPYLSGSAFER